MVRLKGPGLAQAAHGGLGKVLIFAETEGRAYAKKWHQPRNPNSAGQLAMRAITRYIAQRWANFPTANQATWDELAAHTTISPYNACLSFNLDRWRRFLAPTETNPAAYQTGGGAFNPPTLDPIGRQARFSCNVTATGTGRGWTLHKLTAPGAPKAWNNLVYIIPIVGLGIHTFDYGPLGLGTHYFAIDWFLERGRFPISTVLKTITIT